MSMIRKMALSALLEESVTIDVLRLRSFDPELYLVEVETSGAVGKLPAMWSQTLLCAKETMKLLKLGQKNPM